MLYTSPQIELILGYTPEEWIADPTAWYEWVHPDDRADERPGRGGSVVLVPFRCSYC